MSDKNKGSIKEEANRILNKFKTALLVMGVLAGSPAQAKTAEKSDNEWGKTENYQDNNNRPHENAREVSLDELIAMTSGSANVARYSSLQEEYVCENGLRYDAYLSSRLPSNSIYCGAYIKKSTDYRLPDKVVYLPKDMEYNRGAIRTIDVNIARECSAKHQDMYNPHGRYVYGPNSQYGYGYGQGVATVGGVVHEIGRIAHDVEHTVRDVEHTVRVLKRVFDGKDNAPKTTAPRTTAPRTIAPRNTSRDR